MGGGRGDGVRWVGAVVMGFGGWVGGWGSVGGGRGDGVRWVGGGVGFGGWGPW